MNRLTPPIAFLFLLAASSAAFAASSPWFTTEGAKLRLIAMPGADGTRMRAGLQIELEDGWKTYWRQPGASGIPPQLDFSASQNLKEVRFSFPAPRVFHEADGTSVGYKKRVTFPIAAQKPQRSQPALLAVRGVIGICSTICVPLPFQLSVELSSESGSRLDIAMAIREAEAALPRSSVENMAIESSFLEGTDTLIVGTRVPKDAQRLELLPEGPFEWYLQPAKLVSRAGERARFEVALPVQRRGAASLALTLVADGKAIEQAIELPEAAQVSE